MENKNITWKSFVLVLGIASIPTCAVWYLLQDNIKERDRTITELQKVIKLDYPSFLNKINLATENLSTHLKKLEYINNLKKEKNKLENDNKKLSIELDILNKDYNKNLKLKESQLTILEEKYRKVKNNILVLKNRIKELSLKKVELTLNKGEAKSLKGGVINIGYVDNTDSNKCTLTVNNKIYNMVAGEYIDIGKDCKALLTKCPNTSYEKAYIELLCK
ncbi:hypothetical protein [Poseidonibacter lekithochrous]|uniref:hypothetical protein n=1 Tax=Poseidonibacter lekithochrous TaxID=1904463 RepID=UPI000D36CC96|nr:hypothetical protein [Poseidonibacter lekithochrous]